MWDSGQSWVVLGLVGPSFFIQSRLWVLTGPTISGVGIGLNAAFISIITEWLSDIKMGYCSDGWWLNQQFCCWEIEGEEVDGCDSWRPWSTVTIARWFIFVLFAVS